MKSNERNNNCKEHFQPITRVFAYKTGTFDKGCYESSDIKPIPKYGFKDSFLVDFFLTGVKGLFYKI